MTDSKHPNAVKMDDERDAFLRRQAWDHFNTHAGQRMALFNFYIALSSVTAAGYIASFKSDSNLGSVRWIIALLLCFFAFIFWKLDQRVKFLIKVAEKVMKRFEAGQPHDALLKVFIQEQTETQLHRERFKGWRRLLFWRRPLSYSDCFNLVYGAFFLLGAVAILQAVFSHIHWPQ